MAVIVPGPPRLRLNGATDTVRRWASPRDACMLGDEREKYKDQCYRFHPSGGMICWAISTVPRVPSAGAGGDDGQAPGEPRPAGAAVGGLAEDQALLTPIAGAPTPTNRKGPATGQRWRNDAIRDKSSTTGANRNREISELVLTNVSKFRVSFGEVVDMERNFATMELIQRSVHGHEPDRQL